MPDYNAMRQDAVRRAIEMQSRAQKTEIHVGGEQKKEAKEDSASVPSSSESSNAATLQSPSNVPNSENLFQLLFKDSERTLILLLLLLLSTEETDPALLFALLYLCL